MQHVTVVEDGESFPRVISPVLQERTEGKSKAEDSEDIITQDGVNTNRELSPQNQDGLPSFPVEK